MKKTLLFIFLFLTNGFLLQAQQYASLNGIVVNESRQALDKATIALIREADSSVVSYTLTDKSGKFNLVRIPAGSKLSLSISHIDGAPHNQSLTLQPKEIRDLDSIMLESKRLNEVVVTAAPPVRMNADTLEYNTNYFKTRPNANVEELLKQLPGLQVNLDGTIYYQGKEVSSVKVNGSDFFASDLRVATRNLDATLVKTVQVYRDRGESKNIVANEEDLPVTINLKFKKDFLRANFGKAYASGGTRGRYEGGALFNTFRDTLQVSLIGFGNNINRQSFDYGELSEHGGMARAENYGFDNLGGRNYWGVGDDKGIGFNLNNDWGKKTKLNIMFMLAHKNSRSSSDGFTNSRYDGVTQFADYMNENEQRNLSNTLRTLFRHRFDSTSFMEFQPTLTLSNNRQKSWSSNEMRTEAERLTSDSSRTDQDGRNFSYAHNLYWEKELAKSHVLSFRNTFTHGTNSSEEDSEQHATLFQTENPDNRIWSSTLEERRNDDFYLLANYANKSFKKFNFESFLSFRHANENPIQELFVDRNGSGSERQRALENSFRYTYQDYITGFRMFFNASPKFAINVGNAYQIKSNHFDFLGQANNIANTKGYWLPNINVRYKSLNFTWARDLQSPQTHGILVNDYNLNPLYVRLQSTEFDNVVVQDYRLTFNKYNNKLQLGLYTGISINDKSVGVHTWRNAQTGQYVSQQYQAGQTMTGQVGMSFRYQLLQTPVWQLYLSNQTTSYRYQQYNSINDIPNQITLWNSQIQQEFTLSWKSLVSLSPSYTFGYNKNLNSVKDNPDFMEAAYHTHVFKLGVNVNPIKGFSLETSYALENRASGIDARQSFHILNSSFYYTLKNQSQLKLSGFDILNQNISNYWGNNGNSTYYSNQLTLRQYFLFGYVHKFNYVKTK
ncbi:carboxypeptidase-like regulatory domain-containing protein [Sphingobacterium bambusae]|uniref:Carboxypeptidase-like regulatory domain-containing protein n=1 Tax=Sphingobacterium bambusae TaxID=662858 RepID=A0ABW6BNE8_9SPHI|nr:carboxypeptidase-like regulatory domain-containing protein [Sphingobacterium bambusae]WPL48180.1 carboxypeptidase-like regulatory domain-containing protein [Sphingobacterium bambusae]